MRRHHAPFESWAAAHQAATATAAEAALYAKLRARLEISDEELRLAIEYRATASQLLAAMLADMKARADSLRVSRRSTG